MARPYFTGNYGSALARVDTRPIIEAGKATGQMYAQMGQDIGGVIKEYGLNKVKRAKLTGEIEAHYKENPEALSQIGMSGDEAQDKKDYTERERFIKGDMNIAQLEGLAGKLARGGVLRSKKLQDKSRVIQNQLGEQNLGLQKRLEDTTVALQESRSQEAATRNRILNMTEEDFSALRDLTQEQRRTYLEGSIAERPSRTAATIARAGGVVREEGERDAYADLRGGPVGVAAHRATVEDLGVEQLETNIDRTQGLIEGLDVQMELMRRPVDTSIPGNVDNSKILKGLRSDISALRKQKSFTKNDDDEFASLEDLIEFDVNTGKATISENASRRDEVALKELVKLVESEYATSMNQIITHTFKNGQTVTAPMGDVMRLIKEEEEEELIKKAKADQKLRNLRNTQGVMRMDYDYTNLDPTIAEMMAGPK